MSTCVTQWNAMYDWCSTVENRASLDGLGIKVKSIIIICNYEWKNNSSDNRYNFHAYQTELLQGGDGRMLIIIIITIDIYNTFNRINSVSIHYYSETSETSEASETRDRKGL